MYRGYEPSVLNLAPLVSVKIRANILYITRKRYSSHVKTVIKTSRILPFRVRLAEATYLASGICNFAVPSSFEYEWYTFLS